METTNYTITVNRYDHGVVNNLAVDPQFLGHGSGCTLVQAAAEFLRGIGCAKINLCVRRENEAVIKFYDKLGYAEETVYNSGKWLIEDQQQPRIFAPIG
ncbi:GNAT family N-acetyltransferase [Alphaproteobacteria bacterium]|nr:GNAT family N-acetyltransferase [Alphaproteobacteria bacterium]MDC1121582.1 GNAT family N-acetyltransferase [Alphaproteobacteria bacterium]